jgi:hypothetical protein
MKIYIAGPMTGYKNWNFPAFFEAEEQLIKLGYEVVNPAHNDGATVQEALESAGSPDAPNNPWRWYMRRDLPHVLEVDALCVLPGWQKSKGASLEVTVAKAIGLPIMVLQEETLVPRVSAVGLSGWARTGKDTVASVLVENYGYKRVSFADPMREALRRLSPNIRLADMSSVPLASAVHGMGWEDLKGMSPDVRELMQRMGTEVGRDMFGQNFWVDLAINNIPDGSKVVFADVRFPNEAEAIKALGGEVWRVMRSGVGPANDHISEHALNDYHAFDQLLSNNGSLEELAEKVKNIMD